MRPPTRPTFPAKHNALTKRILEWTRLRTDAFTCHTIELHVHGYRNDEKRAVFDDLVESCIFEPAGKRGSGVHLPACRFSHVARQLPSFHVARRLGTHILRSHVAPCMTCMMTNRLIVAIHDWFAAQVKDHGAHAMMAQ